jgi:hypothetical protein
LLHYLATIDVSDCCSLRLSLLRLTAAFGAFCCREVFGLKPGETAVISNGRIYNVAGPDADCTEVSVLRVEAKLSESQQYDLMCTLMAAIFYA